MREIDFVSDLRCNYLTIHYGGGEENFALRMMTENAAETFLPMELRRLDGQTFLYYNISGMQSMEVLYGEKPIDRKTFQNFMRQLHEAIEESRELFLPGDGICLEPASLFWELGTERWKFLYIPVQDTGEAGEVQRERESLAEFLVMHMDYEDKELTETVYRFYEEVCAGINFPWGTLPFERPAQETELSERCAGFSEEEASPEKAEEAESAEETENGEAGGKRKAEGRKRRMPLCILCCASIAVTLVSSRIRPEMLLYGGAVSTLLTASLFMTARRKKGHGEWEEYEPKEIMDIEPEEITYNMADREAEYVEQPDAARERTVYIDVESRQERKLYGVGKYRRQKIFLERFPCLVGKDRTLTDHLIEDFSVSRIHARFSMEEETVWMQDLNSTNGTYHNGMRLKPHEKVALEPEDEVGFGQAQFVFR